MTTFTEKLKTTKIQTYENAYKEYLENPKSLLGKRKGMDNMGKPTCMNIVKSEFHIDNSAYVAFRNVCSQLSDTIEYEESFISSTIGIGNNKTILRQHNRIRIDTTVGHICIAPYEDGLELTRIIIDGRKGKGAGTMMMNLFFHLIQLSHLDLETLPIMLECVGSVGGGSNYCEDSNLSQQTKFFRKFGFRVDPTISNHKGGYVQMKFKNELVIEYKKSFCQ